MEDILKTSPDGNHTAQLVYEGEIRYGPPYYKFLLDEKSVRGIFGDELAWSSDSRLLAIQEWRTTDYETGPITRAALFDVEKNNVSCLQTVRAGFAGDFIFENGGLIYKKRYLATGKVEEVEVDISKISNWRNIE